MATKMVIARPAANLELNKLEGGQTPNSIMPRHCSNAGELNTGVRNPIKTKAPVAVTTISATSSAVVRCEHAESEMIPWAARVTPAAVRKIKSPIPGGPPGNAEYSLCRVHLPFKYLNALQRTISD